MKRLLIPLFLTLLLASSLAAQTRVTLGPERVVATFSRPTLLAVGVVGRAPAFAAAGRDGHYLMAWSEYEDVPSTRASLHTAAIDATGAIIEGSRFAAPAVRTTDPNAQYPAVAFDGEHFLVAWIEGSSMVTRVLAMRFDRDGKPLEPMPQTISLDARHTMVAIAAGGGEFIIAYGRWGSGPGTLSAVARMRADGTVLERDRTIPGTPGFWRDIESNGTTALLINESMSSSFPCLPIFCSPLTSRTFSRVGPGTSIAANPVPEVLAPQSVGSGIATDGQRFLAVTTSPIAGQPGWLVRGQLTDTSGASFVREFLVAKHAPAMQLAGGRIDAVWTGGSYAIAYEQAPSNLDVNLILVFASQIGMTLTDPVELASSNRQERTPVILPLGESRVLVLYERGEYERPEIVARQATLSMRTRAVR